MTDMAALALKDRICDATDRIPTSRWPFFSQSLDGALLVGGTTVTLTFEAERDTLLTDLSIAVEDSAGADLAAKVEIDYCNTQYAAHTDCDEFRHCCDRKPIFLVGVRENKKLKLIITLDAAAPVGGAKILATLSGFQGDGCCS